MNEFAIGTSLLLLAVFGSVLAIFAPATRRARLWCVAVLLTLGAIAFCFQVSKFAEDSHVELGAAVGHGLRLIGQPPAVYVLIFFGGAFAGILGMKHLARRAAGVPLVKNWMSPLDAIDTFVDPELRIEYKNAMQKTNKFGATHSALAALFAQRPRRIGPTGGVSMPPDVEDDALVDQMAAAKSAQHDWAANAQLKRNHMIDDLKAQLRKGAITARGLLVANGAVASTKSFIPQDLWDALEFQPFGADMKRAGCQGWEYRGIEIGRNERAR